MSLRPAQILVLAISLFALVAVSGCGEEHHETEVPEGEPLELGELAFDVQITRFLNPNSTEDAAYLEGAAPLEEGEQYLGVFMQVDNEGEETNVVPFPFKVIDTRGTIYPQAELENPFSLIPGTPVEPGESVPGPETAARTGPIQGSLVLFVLPEEATEDRPLQLQIPGPGESGLIELDL